MHKIYPFIYLLKCLFAFLEMSLIFAIIFTTIRIITIKTETRFRCQVTSSSILHCLKTYSKNSEMKENCHFFLAKGQHFHMEEKYCCQS